MLLPRKTLQKFRRKALAWEYYSATDTISSEDFFKDPQDFTEPLSMYDVKPTPFGFLANSSASFTSGKNLRGLCSPLMHRMGNNNKLHKYTILHRSVTGCCSIDHNKISVIDSEKLKAEAYLPIHQAVITTASWHWYRKLKDIRNSFGLNNTGWECQRAVAEGHNYKMLCLESLI